MNIKNKSSALTFLKTERKYKRPLLIRQENHSLKMLTMTFQKSQFLSNRQEHVKEKKIPKVIKRKQKDRISVRCENCILQGYFRSHFPNGDSSAEGARGPACEALCWQFVTLTNAVGLMAPPIPT